MLDEAGNILLKRFKQFLIGLRWTPLSRPFFARNKLMSGGVFWVSFWGGE
jgi:hypothetical protein